MSALTDIKNHTHCRRKAFWAQAPKAWGTEAGSKGRLLLNPALPPLATWGLPTLVSTFLAGSAFLLEDPGHFTKTLWAITATFFFCNGFWKFRACFVLLQSHYYHLVSIMFFCNPETASYLLATTLIDSEHSNSLTPVCQKD